MPYLRANYGIISVTCTNPNLANRFVVEVEIIAVMSVIVIFVDVLCILCKWATTNKGLLLLLYNSLKNDPLIPR